MSINMWLNNQMCFSHTMKYYSGIKKNELLKHVTTWMNLKTILLSERHKILKEYRLYDSIYIIPKKIQTNSWSEADQYLLVDESEG